VCFRGNCVDQCGGGEFPCPSGTECDSASGFCMDPLCVGITCDAGEVCRGGDCVGPCDGVTCPTGQTCQVGRCVDPCNGVSCDAGLVCDRGACVPSCTCRGCSEGADCNEATGQCVDAGCQDMNCEAGLVCKSGACVDPCTGALCPGGAACSNGQCGEPVSGTGGSGSGIIRLPDGGITIGGGTTGAGGSAGGGARASRATSDSAGCACRNARGARSSALLAWPLLLLLGWRRWRRPEPGRPITRS
jgi:hypothetical protein